MIFFYKGDDHVNNLRIYQTEQSFRDVENCEKDEGWPVTLEQCGQDGDIVLVQLTLKGRHSCGESVLRIEVPEIRLCQRMSEALDEEGIHPSVENSGGNRG